MKKDAPSRYKRHLAHLNLSRDVNPDDLPLQEKKEIDDIRLPGLTLEKKKAPWLFPWLTGLTLASVALLFIVVPIFQENDPPPLTFKGDTRISVVVERNGQFVEFVEAKGAAGDRINFEVLASSPVKVYLTLYDRKEQELLTESEVLSTELRIEAGQKASFANAITLTDSNDGERAVVNVCAANVAVRDKDNNSLNFTNCLRKKYIFRP